MAHHWLNDVAAHAGLALALPTDANFPEIAGAWLKVAQACRLSDEEFTRRVAGHFRVGYADLSAYDPQAVKLIPEAVARQYGIVALSADDGTITVATADPSTVGLRRAIVDNASRQPVFAVASPNKLTPAIERAYAPARAPKNALQTLVAQVASTDFQVISVQGNALSTSFGLDDPALVKLTNFFLQQAARYRATEIHVEPGLQQGRVRYRIDGIVQQVVDLPMVVHSRVIARLKHMARPQPGAAADGGFSVSLDGSARRAQLVVTGSPDGELALLRLIDPAAVPKLTDLNFDFQEGGRIRQLLLKPDGFILVTGPARSGTSTFVYAALEALRHRSAISLEGRPEVVVPGVTQIRYDPTAGVPFAEALQKLLDRSPDVLHAGEIRDLATARIVLRTAVTGRKVLATMHTPDAVSGVRRLIEMGLAPGRLAESLQAVISLRLVRRLCAACARPFDPQKDGKSREAALATLIGVRPVRCPVGCKTCAGTGYLGQIPLSEILTVSGGLRDLLVGNPSDAELLRGARADGMRTFTEVALDRVAKGDTTVEEIERVLGIVPMRTVSASSVGPILVVEDVAEDRLLLVQVLKRMGFRVIEAENAQPALEMLKADPTVCLVLIDLHLPGMQGTELLHQIRRSLATQALPAVVVTASDNPRNEIDLLNAGADDYILKPVVPERVEARIRAVLRRAGVRLTGGENAASA